MKHVKAPRVLNAHCHSHGVSLRTDRGTRFISFAETDDRAQKRQVAELPTFGKTSNPVLPANFKW